MKTFSNVLVLAGVTDEAGIVVNGSNNQGTHVGEKRVRYTSTFQGETLWTVAGVEEKWGAGGVDAVYLYVAPSTQMTF